ncbi:MAG TPA: tetratricopeptide repeat protein [Chromatiales bacterium]|nr:tetratricopeptide repeat protein [Chromatiales bacterium]
MTVHRAIRYGWPGLIWAVLAMAEPGSHTVFGPDPALVDGARALQLRDFDTGIELTLEGLAATVDPADRAAALSNLCAGYVGTKQYERALQACDAALAIRPLNWRTWSNRALAWLGKGQLVQARRDLEAGLRIAPEAHALQEVAERLEHLESRLKLASAP